MSRLPIAWSPSGPGETNRYCRTSAHVRPDSSSPQSAARAIRRSPGGRQPSSCAQPAGRTAVVGDGHDRGEPVGHAAQGRERGGQAVPAAERHHGRAHVDHRPPLQPDGRPRLAGGLIRARGPGAGRWSAARRPAADGRAPRRSRCCGACRRCSRCRWWRTACPPAGSRTRPCVRTSSQRGQERGGARLAEHVRAHRGAEAGLRAQLGHPVRVGQEADVEDHVGVQRDAVLEAEREDRDPQRVVRPAVRVADPGAELVHVQRGGVDDQVGRRPQGGQQVALAVDAVEQAAVALQRVRAPDGLLAPHDDLVGRLEVDDLGDGPGAA